MKMTRPARARPRQLVAVWLGWVLWWSAGGACAQVRAELERALRVTRELPGCVSASGLRVRTAQYLGRAESLPQLTIEVDLEVPEFRVLRGGSLLAQRRFERAPADCSARRDAIALAVAIAIEQVAENAASTAESAQPSAAAVPGEAAASDAAGRATGEPTSRVGADQEARGASSRGSVREARVRDADRGFGARDLEAPARSADSRVGDRAETARAGQRSEAGDAAPRARGASQPAAASGGLPLLAADEGSTQRLIALSGGALVLFEALPAAALAFSVGAELAAPALRIALSGLFSLPVSSAFQGGTVSAQLFGAQLTGCVNTPIFASFLLHGCAGATAGVIEARGDDFALNLSDQMGWLAGLARARLEFPADGLLALSVYADGRVNVLRPELQARVANEPVRTRAVNLLGATLGLELLVRLH